MREALRLIEAGEIDVSVLISHIGGLNCAAETTKSLPRIPGAKKLIYCNADLPLTAIDEFAEKGKSDPFLRTCGISALKATCCGAGRRRNIF